MAMSDTGRKYLNSERASEALDAWRSSGMSLKEFAQSQGLSETTLTRWQRRLSVTPLVSNLQPRPSRSA